MVRQNSFSMGSLLEMLFRRKKLALGLPILIIGMGLAIALFFPRTYQSQARLFLQIGRESVAIDPTAQTGQQMISLQQQGRDSEVTSAMDLMTSRQVIGKVVDNLTPEMILAGAPLGEGESETNFLSETIGTAISSLIATIKSIDPISDREEAIIKVEKSLEVDSERDSTMINLAYSTKSPRGAQMILDEIIKVYKEEHLRIHRNDGSHEFFNKQSEELRARLDNAMETIRKEKNAMGITSISDRRTNLESQLQSVQLASYNSASELAAAEASLADLTIQLGNLPERMIATKKQVPNEGADLLREQLYALKVRKMDLKARYNDSHPLVRAVSDQVDAAEEEVNKLSELREETTDDVNPIHRELSLSVKQTEGRIAGLNGRLTTLDEQEELIRSDLEKLNADEVRLHQLERDKDLLNKKFYQYTENLEQARIDEALEEDLISSVSIAQEPTLTEKPVSPSKVLVGLGSLVLAFAGTGGLLLGMEQIDTKVRDDNTVERIAELPVLATIPESSSHSRVYS